MKACQLLNAFVAFPCQLHVHLSPVAAADATSYQSGDLAPRNQRHDAMMLRLQAFGEFADVRRLAPGKAFYLEHQQVLQGRDSSPLRQIFAETQVAAQLVAEVGQRFEIRLGYALLRHFLRVAFPRFVSRHDIVGWTQWQVARARHLANFSGQQMPHPAVTTGKQDSTEPDDF